MFDDKLRNAILKNDKQLLEELIKSGISPNALDSFGVAPLFHAINFGTVEIMEILLKAGADVNYANSKGYSPWYLAVEKRDMEKIRLLAAWHADMEIQNHLGNSAIHLAAMRGDEKVFDYLISHASDAVILAVNRRGETLLHLAAAWHNLSIVQICLERTNIDRNALNRDGETALLKAVKSGDLKMSHFLFSSGCDPDMSIHGLEHPLTAAIEFMEHDGDALNFLMDLLSNPDSIPFCFPKERALWLAVKSNWIAGVKLILRFQPDVNYSDESGSTPIGLAFAQKNLLMAKLLLQHGANPQSKVDEKSILSLAVLNHDSDWAELLLLFDNNDTLDDGPVGLEEDEYVDISMHEVFLRNRNIGKLPYGLTLNYLESYEMDWQDRLGYIWGGNVRAEFCAGKLYLRSPFRTAIIQGWPHPAAIEKNLVTEGRWQPFIPPLLALNYVLHSSVEYSGDMKPWLLFYETIPSDIRQLLEPFPNKWEMLLFIAYGGKAARDLLMSNPALVYIWIVKHKFWEKENRNTFKLRKWLMIKQTELLTRLNLPGTQSYRKMLAKLFLNIFNEASVERFLNSLSNPKLYSFFSHLPWLNKEILEFVTEQNLDILTPSLIVELSQNKDTWEYFHDTLVMKEHIYPYGIKRKICTCDELMDFHDRLSARIKFMDIENLTFPLPPLPGSDGIIPLTEVKDLQEEGNAQHNCVASYSYSVAETDSVYIYRMEKPERCTLEICRQASGQWELAQIKAIANRDASPKAIAAATQWLRESQKYRGENEK